MGKTAAAASKTNGPQYVESSKHKSKKSKSGSRKKQQEADLTGIGSQFWQDNQAQQSSNPADYPNDITLEDEQ